MADADRRPPTLAEPRTLVATRRPRGQPVRVGVFADPHLAARATGTWKVYHRTETLLRRSLATLLGRDVDRLLCLGDLTKDGEARNFDLFDEVVADCPVPLSVLPGNHDVPKTFDDHEGLSFDAFRRRYAPGGYPATWRVGDLTVVGLNSARTPDGSLADTWAGAVSDRQLRALDDVLAEAPNPVVACHHNLFALPEHDGAPWTNFPLRNRHTVRERLATHDVPLVLSGHHHVPATRREDGIREVIVPATCSFPHAVAVLDVDRTGTTIELHPVATPPEVADGYSLAASGDPLGADVVSMAADRLDRLPLSEP